MGIKANYLKIGVFVIFTFALLTGGVVFWGAEAFRQKKYFVETYIDQSVQGLTVGSPVYSRGVQLEHIASCSGHTPALFVLHPTDVQRRLPKLSNFILQEQLRRCLHG